METPNKQKFQGLGFCPYCSILPTNLLGVGELLHAVGQTKNDVSVFYSYTKIPPVTLLGWATFQV